ncbi:MAG: T9SS type A sorting domain-containing protein, partial [Candidatus Zixiibacteriota bacterium]
VATYVVLAVLLMAFPVQILGRLLYEPRPADNADLLRSANEPCVDYAVHNIGKIGFTVTNTGKIGTGFQASIPGNVPSCVYPYPGNNEYLYAGALWIGAVVGQDTLVSVGADGWQFIMEMWPDKCPEGEIAGSETASEQNYIAVFTDTLTDPAYVAYDNFEGRPHLPLNVEVTQNSYAWSYAFAEDFVLLDYSIKNMGQAPLEKMYIGFYVDGDVMYKPELMGFNDDICGFRETIESPVGCGFVDTVNIAWIADNDGKSLSESCPYGSKSLTSVTGACVLWTPSDSLEYSFNWWVPNGNAGMDWGPRLQEDFRHFNFNDTLHDFLGTPEGDRNKYYMMRHHEVDYDQLFAAVDHTTEGWMPAFAYANDLADGIDTRYLLSFGPFDLDPGQSLPLVLAYVAGENFHTDCRAFDTLFDPSSPDAFYDQLDFTDLGLNATWASWMYDNPGVDTDGDGYAGKYRICAYDSILVVDTISTNPLIVDTTWEYTLADTLWYEGDGIPDLGSAETPPSGSLRLTPKIGALIVRWNGLESETERDPFSNRIDFEGYNIYYSTINEPGAYLYVAGYDLENYLKFTYIFPSGYWDLRDWPYTLEELQNLYSITDPLSYTPNAPLNYQDSFFYFDVLYYNNSDLTNPSLIHKVYPDQAPPTTLNIDSAETYYPDELTDDGFFKYYEYEYKIGDLLSGAQYFVKVTSLHYDLFTDFDETLREMDSAYTLSQTGIGDDPDGLIPDRFALYQNYPNPFNAATEIAFDLPQREKVKLIIFNMLGQVVRTVDLGENPAGRHSVVWDGTDDSRQTVATGIYLYQIRAGEFESSKKMMLLK